jgi:hypothetical protein
VKRGRFLNQKLGKRASRKIALLKSSLATGHQPARAEILAARFPKKGMSRENSQSRRASE